MLLQLFGSGQVARVLAQGAQALAQTLQAQTRLLQQRQRMQQDFAVREQALQAREQVMTAEQEKTALELETEKLKFQKLRAETELKQSDVLKSRLGTMQLEVAANDPVEFNRRFQSLSELTRERNRLEGQLTRLQEDIFLSQDEERINRTKKEMDQISISVDHRLNEMAKRGVGREEALVPIETAKPAADLTSVVQAEKAQATTAAQPVDETTSFVSVADKFLGAKNEDLKAAALTQMASIMKGADRATQTALMNELVQSLIQSGKEQDEAIRIVMEEIRPKLFAK